jgi:hypothetical protein
MSPTWPTSCSFDGSLLSHLQLLGADQAAVAPGQAHGLAAGLVDEADDVLLHLAGQHPFDDFHGLGVGHAHALDELALLAQAVERRLDLRAAAVHHHRVDAHQLEQHHVFREVGLQFGSVMALPPYLMTMVLPWNLRMYGSAWARISALSRGAMEVTSFMGANRWMPANCAASRGGPSAARRRGMPALHAEAHDAVVGPPT